MEEMQRHGDDDGNTQSPDSASQHSSLIPLCQWTEWRAANEGAGDYSNHNGTLAKKLTDQTLEEVTNS